MPRKKLSLAIMNALNAGVVVGLATPFAFAQTPIEKIEKIEVTGSRIPSPTLTSESPVNVISAQEIKYTGLTSTSDIINQLPQAAPEQGGNLSNGATGISTVNLRGLGSSRTLVLINGRRVPAGSITQWATDLNAIPAPLIQRVEVLTGGASSVYGSDAIAGVVNFIMNDRFEGIQFDYNGNWFNHNQHSFVGDIVAARALTNPAQYAVPGDVSADGDTHDFAVTLGGNFAGGKGNATVYFEYRKADAVTQASRDFSACSLAAGVSAYSCLGSSTSYPGRFTDFSNYNFTIANAAGNIRPYVGANDSYNFAPTNYYQRPDKRYLGNFFAHYDMHPNVRAYTEFSFMDDHTVAQIAPSGAFLQPFTINNANPFLSQQFKDTVGLSAANPEATFYIGRRNVEGGGRQSDLRHTDYRIVLGAKGSVPWAFQDKWDYNLWWQYGKNLFEQKYLNDFSVVRLGRAMDVVTNPANGQPVCRSVLDGTDPNCVPWNIFQIGGVTNEALDYLQTPGFQTGYTKQSVWGLNLTSDLGTAYGWKTPWARDGVSVALGIERRLEALSSTTDTAFSTGDLAGQGGATIGLSGSYTVVEPYAEARIPIVQRRDWFYDLSVTGAYRYSDYDTGITTNTYGIGADWAPVREAKVRGTYQRAVRAPNVIDLFTAQGYNLFSGADPCAGQAPSATLAQCANSGVTAAQYGRIPESPAGQYNYLQGGNPDLDPEKAKTWTLGVVFQPTANLSGTIDYWHYNVDEVIGVINPQTALLQCVNVGQLCNLIFRGPNGNLWLPNQGYVLGTNVNLGKYETDGIDITANYTYAYRGWGTFGFAFQGTWLNNFKYEPVPGLGEYNCAGYYGPTCGIPYPEWRHKFQTIWGTPWYGISASLAWRYVDSVKVDFSSSNPLLAGSYSQLDAELKAQNYFDLAVQWVVNKNFTVRGGINNLFDNDPPIVGSNAGAFPAVAGPPYGNGNTFPQVYDTLGRTLFLGVTAKF
jgi:outer membrane receptor protein involved in Fe transport